ncbi:poly [ADP-ribose] polymerase 2 isoform X2 [Crotalus tigris]|uniref:poly [ADP-ribose] polymerase 2 isoform X2 n=1 Tax=Crotalus tigris TaxID=88082 RepID=UPI00192F2855|nr:poly [ADP-ribose] polymerase 2 isoform X2 [Crotalus tigris]
MKRKRKAPEVQPADAGTQPALRWEREISDNKWQIFPSGQSEALSQAIREQKSTEDFGEDIVDLCKMVEWNKQSGEENRVRVAVWDQKSYLVWQWEGDQENDWNPYPAATCLDLQAAKNGYREPIVDLTVGRTRYKLDTDRMVQTNQRTKFERRMECRESDATEAVGGSQLNSRDLDASTAVPAKKSQTELDALASRGEGDGQEAVKTLTVKGKAPVDPECTAKAGKAHVYCEGDDIYDVMLNQTNLQFNNNKYYLIQLLEEDNAQNYSVWMRWGRVGKPGQHSLVPCSGDLAKAKDIFTKKFLDKTKNEWDKRNSFQKVSGKYDLLHLDYEARDAENSADAGPEKTVSKPKPVSQLEPRVQALLELICNIRMMEEMVIEMKYDTRKAPLGKLTAEQIQAGYRSLQKVEACLKRSQTGAALLEACNEFYTRIPHDFGLKTPPLIKTLKELQEKAQLLEVLERYLLSTHAPTHKDYTMTLVEAFEVNKKSSEATFRFDLSNRMLLWHGSRLGNWAGILSQGLRVAPPEAPITGYMFGKGIYFADMSSKSANYCFATREKDIGLLLLSEVALGECNELLEADPEAERLPASKHSTKGLGKLAPANCVSLHGAIVPLGPAVETGIANSRGYTLNYNEFIVYDPCQVRMKYLLKVRFNFVQLW